MFGERLETKAARARVAYSSSPPQGSAWIIMIFQFVNEPVSGIVPTLGGRQ